MTESNRTAGARASMPRRLLHIEGATLFIAATAFFFWTGGVWWWYALLLLAPDLTMLGYLAGPKMGALIYDLGHAYPAPALLGLIGILAGAPFLLSLASIWFAHIGMDRTVGYGLKYASGFRDTHLQRT